MLPASLRNDRTSFMHDFSELFSKPPVVHAQAPGRVNLIGEHTDYNGGFVLPTAIPQHTRVELAQRQDHVVRAWSSAVALPAPRIYTLGEEKRTASWLDYIQGLTSILRSEGHALLGFDVRIESSVPLGSGLSSSASLTVSLQRALRAAFALRLDDVTIARISRRVENEFVGAQVGIMDPMAASLADQGTALFLDARSLEFERVPLPVGAELVVIDSSVAHRNAAGDYNTRRRECEQASALLGVSQLRDLTVADLPKLSALPEPLKSRARHVITENDRVLEAVAAMRAGDLDRLGKLFYASHASMRDDYQVSIPEIDSLVELGRTEPDVFGARLTGGGFGGSVVMLARVGTGRTVAQRIAQIYDEQSGFRSKILVPAC